jgi:NAD(P)H dehydrogenase (quinone)
MAAIMAEVTGKSIRYVNIPEGDARKAMIGAGFPEWIADFINDLRRMESQGGASAVRHDIETVTGKPATPFRTTLVSILGASGVGV